MSKDEKIKKMTVAEFLTEKDNDFAEQKTEDSESKRAKTRDKILSEIKPSEGEPEKKSKRGRPAGARKKKKRKPVFTKEVGELYVSGLNSILTVLELELISGDFKKSYVDISTKFFDKKFGDKIQDEDTFMFIILTGALITTRSVEAQKIGLFNKIKNRWSNRKILRFKNDISEK